MSKKVADESWFVRPHDPLRELDDGLWIVDGDLDGMPLRRRMVVVRLRSGELLIHNAIALDEAEMAALEGLGKPRYLMVPSAYHRLDAPRYRARYPDLVVLAPAGARAKIEQKVPVDATYDALPEALARDGAVEILAAAGTRAREGILVVHGGAGQTAVFNDALFNLPHGKGAFWFIYGRLMGNAGGLLVTTLGRWFIVKDKPAFAAQLRALADREALRRIIVAHGDLIESEPGAALRAAAEALS